MIIGIPKGLLFYNYHVFVESFFTELGAQVIVSENTSKQILDIGTVNCVDEACLPIKVFHGHVGTLKDKCDYILVPRFMSIYKNEYICPKFCGLPEMITSAYKNINIAGSVPIYTYSNKMLYKWCKESAHIINRDDKVLHKAYENALSTYKAVKTKKEIQKSSGNIGIIGHPYNVFDSYVNLNIIDKLKKMKFNVITEEFINDKMINSYSLELFKKPFWTFARRNYGMAAYLADHKLVNGIIYISSFSCGIDSVLIELIKYRLSCFPIMVIKLDELTGEAGLDTRLEAFTDMLQISH